MWHEQISPHFTLTVRKNRAMKHQQNHSCSISLSSFVCPFKCVLCLPRDRFLIEAVYRLPAARGYRGPGRLHRCFPPPKSFRGAFLRMLQDLQCTIQQGIFFLFCYFIHDYQLQLWIYRWVWWVWPIRWWRVLCSIWNASGPFRQRSRHGFWCGDCGALLVHRFRHRVRADVQTLIELAVSERTPRGRPLHVCWSNNWGRLKICLIWWQIIP